MNEILNWIYNYIEAIGTFISIIYIYFSIKQKIWLWPLGLISSILYVYIFYDHKIYADMGLQLYYVVISIYGWYSWNRSNIHSNNQTNVQLLRNNHKLTIVLLAVSFIIFIIISQILIYFTDSPIPYADAFTTSLSIVATWMLAKRYIENWLIWILIDAVSSLIYMYKDLYFTVFLYGVYTIMAVVGYRTWLMDLKGNKHDTIYLQ